MRKSFTADGVVLPDDQGVWAALEIGIRSRPERVLLARTDGPPGAVVDIDGGEFAGHVRRVAAELLGIGVGHGDRIAIMGRSSYPWVVVSYAALALGAVIVPVYPTASPAQVRHIVTDSAASWAFAETDEQAAVVTEAATGLRHPTWLLGQIDVWTTGESSALEDGAAGTGGLADEEVQRGGKVRADDLAMVIYTSGTTGLPKGVMLTHRNMYASSAGTVEHTGEMFRVAPDGSQATTLLCLPLTHVFGQTILLACLYAGSRTVILPGMPDLVPAMPTVRPTFLAVVPYALEKIRKRAAGLPGDEVAALCGGRLTQVICGGASLDDTTAGFFAGAGVNILNCYGLTEAATAVTVNQPAANRRRTVGRPIPGTTVAIADDGEVLVAGLNVSPGYWSSQQHDLGRDATGPTAQHFLPTGDIGHLDDDGYLVITGRRKEILVTAGGKNVAPTQLEDRVRLHPLVSNCMVVGEARSFVSALLTLDRPALVPWAEANGVDLGSSSASNPLAAAPVTTAGDEAAGDEAAGDEAEGWWEHPRLLAELQTAVDDANSLVSRAESIRAFRVLEGDFTVDGGHLTPSMKLRRATIEQEFTEAIAGIYQ
ncbi:Acyl-CoA synthetase [Frankia sp. AiPs1]|uniref:AMP-dependent synthetase/ligase n=1 Tax=Frankia sp. AiPa1 TaxID=573492 RepID=UPI00202AFB73|nr:AMP-dependent synthetase/ligase [Frankia sp. AiPa1]MCL9760241.1 AMP-dependent synthetase/ligase [Frankia sp. AiPa1]